MRATVARRASSGLRLPSWRHASRFPKTATAKAPMSPHAMPRRQTPVGRVRAELAIEYASEKLIARVRAKIVARPQLKAIGAGVAVSLAKVATIKWPA